MNVKNIIVSASVIIFYVGGASAYDGKIEFSGEITDGTCSVSTDSSTDTINLNSVSAKSFSHVGDSAGNQQFGIVLKDCPSSIRTAAVTFDGTVDTSSNDKLLALSKGDDVATGIGIGLYESDGSTFIGLDKQSKSAELSSTSDNKLLFVAKYVATSTTIKSGKVRASATFTITYQ